MRRSFPWPWCRRRPPVRESRWDSDSAVGSSTATGRGSDSGRESRSPRAPTAGVAEATTSTPDGTRGTITASTGAIAAATTATTATVVTGIWDSDRGVRPTTIPGPGMSGPTPPPGARHGTTTASSPDQHTATGAWSRHGTSTATAFGSPGIAATVVADGVSGGAACGGAASGAGASGRRSTVSIRSGRWRAPTGPSTPGARAGVGTDRAGVEATATVERSWSPVEAVTDRCRPGHGARRDALSTRKVPVAAARRADGLLCPAARVPPRR